MILLCNPEHQDTILLVGFSSVLIFGSGFKIIADCADYNHRKLRSTKEREVIKLRGKRYYYCGVPGEEKGRYLDEIDEDDGYLTRSMMRAVRMISWWRVMRK